MTYRQPEPNRDYLVLLSELPVFFVYTWTRFVRWNMRGSEYPPRWRDALDRREAA